MSKVPKSPGTQKPSCSLCLVRDLSWHCLEKGATVCQVEMARAIACPTDIVGVEPGESSWQGSARKGVPGPLGSDFRGKNWQLESGHSLGFGDSRVESKEQEAVRNILGCKEGTGMGREEGFRPLPYSFG